MSVRAGMGGPAMGGSSGGVGGPVTGKAAWTIGRKDGMERLTIDSVSGRYEVIVGRGACMGGGLTRALGSLSGRAALVTQPNLWRRYGDMITGAFGEASVDLSVCFVGYGERSKSARTLARLWRSLASGGFTRDCMVVAFGGGLVGDVAGLLAATMFRGMEWLNIPTSLLAQVDACIGGKTAINLPEGRNLVGVFHPPSLVLVDPDFLDSLPPRMLRSGLGEVAKYAVGIDVRVWRLCHELSAYETCDTALISACLRAKSAVVSEDELESGARRLLNLGHTLGHAVEAARPGLFTHGEAVALGLRFALGLSRKLGMASDAFLSASYSLLDRFGLPDAVPADLSFDELEPFLAVDKKNRAGGLTWVLPVEPGRSRLVDGIDASFLEDVYKRLPRR